MRLNGLWLHLVRRRGASGTNLAYSLGRVRAAGRPAIRATDPDVNGGARRGSVARRRSNRGECDVKFHTIRRTLLTVLFAGSMSYGAAQAATYQVTMSPKWGVS